MNRHADPQAAGFWEGLAAGVVRITRCQSCRQWQHPPLERCRHCGGLLAYEALSGRGHLYSFIVTHYPAYPAQAEDIPYAVGLVAIEEEPGLRLLGRVADGNPALEIGMRVEIRPCRGRNGELRLAIARSTEFPGTNDPLSEAHSTS
jgi:uncharacterized OB-fold protein